MRSLWNALSFLAVVNLLALIIVIAWLWQSGRLTPERIGDMRQMLSRTVQDARAEAHKLATEAESARLTELVALAREHPAADSATQIRQIALVHDEHEQTRQRLDEERRVLAQQLQDATAQMEADAAALEAERASRAQSSQDTAQRKSDEQFLRAVKQLEQVPPKQAKKMIETLVAQQAMDRAVAYMDAMNPRAASKVLREFKTDAEIALATELLERLRTHGLESTGAAPSASPQPAGGSSAPSSADASAAPNSQPVTDAE